MNDPHVENIVYTVSTEGAVRFKDPQALVFSTDLGDFELAAGELKYSPAQHFATANEARAVVEPFLRTWELGADLKYCIGVIRFTFSRADIFDRDPKPGATQTIYLQGISQTTMFGQATLHVTYNAYPPPLKTFQLTPEVEFFYQRWVAYKSGREHLQSMSFFILSFLEWIAGSRSKAGEKYFVHQKVLKTLGDLCTTRGNPNTARKVEKNHSKFIDLSIAEKRWMEQAILRLIQRVGEHATGEKLDPISMQELPDLPTSPPTAPLQPGAAPPGS
ncbi:MAG: hypothetical protein HS116_21035 [Planctomycetes bacterium]|nr:hypothetical protein [Planctomycetota bacterium]